MGARLAEWSSAKLFNIQIANSMNIIICLIVVSFCESLAFHCKKHKVQYFVMSNLSNDNLFTLDSFTRLYSDHIYTLIRHV